jgi:hypothetical protein
MNSKFSVKSLGIACLFLIVFVVGTNTPLISRAQSSPQLKRQCGTQVSNPQLNGFFWAFPRPQPGSTQIKRLTAGTSKVEIKAPIIDRSANVFAAQPQLSQDKRIMIFLTVDNSAARSYEYGNAIVALNVVTADGTWLTFPPSPDWKHWFQLAPEMKPGHFGVLSLGDDSFLTLLDLSWSGTQVHVETVRRLAFRALRKTAFNEIVISPGWEFLAQMDDSITGTFAIYSGQEQRNIWSSPDLNLSAIAGVSWAQDKETIGFVNFWGARGDGKLLAIDRKGQARDVIDLSTVLGEDVQFGMSPVLGPTRQLVLTVAAASRTEIVPYKYFLLDVDTKQLTDLCLSGFPMSFDWGPGGNYLLVTESDDNIPGYRVVVIYPQTGDYSYLYLSDPSVYPIAWVTN